MHCFFSFFCMGELTTPDDTNYYTQKRLSVGDITIDSHCNPTVLRIFLKTSKTDCEFKGVHIFVGKTGDDLCPVAAVTAFLAIRGNSPGPMFQFKDRTLSTKQRFIFHIRSALQSAGIDPTQYAGHSFRIGAATTAADVNGNSYRARTNWPKLNTLKLYYTWTDLLPHIQAYAVVMSVHSLHHSGIRSGMFVSEISWGPLVTIMGIK